jgi:periplasmic divalent cation tolerance protein
MVEVHVTFPNADEANALARRAVEKRLAACANVFAGMHSFYWWDGAVQSEDEVAVVFKTAEPVVDALIAFVAGEHSDAVPAIVVHRALAAGQTYEDWVTRETQGAAAPESPGGA